METKYSGSEVTKENPRMSRTEFITISQDIKKEEAETWLLSYLKTNGGSPSSTSPSFSKPAGDPFRSKYLGRLGVGAPPVASGPPEEAKPKSPDATAGEVDIQLKMELRTHEEVRQNYIMKLKKNKILLDEPSKKHQTSKSSEWH